MNAKTEFVAHLKVHGIDAVSHADWLAWAKATGTIHPDVVAFVEANPQHFMSAPNTSGRAWQHASYVVCQANDKAAAILCRVVLGKEVADAFSAFRALRTR